MQMKEKLWWTRPDCLPKLEVQAGPAGSDATSPLIWPPVSPEPSGSSGIYWCNISQGAVGMRPLAFPPMIYVTMWTYRVLDL